MTLIKEILATANIRVLSKTKIHKYILFLIEIYLKYNPVLVLGIKHKDLTYVYTVK